MRVINELNSYIQALEKRLRLGTLLRGAAILAVVALALTILLVLITNAYAFSTGSITGARVALFLALAAAIGFGIALPLYGLNRIRAARKAEAIYPQFKQRLVTFTEGHGTRREPFMELLAADTLEVARGTEPAALFPNVRLLTSLVTGVVALAALLWLITSGPGYFGHGASLLWMGAARESAPFYDLQVSPGDAAVRRNTDQLVTAQLTGVQTDRVTLYARYESTSRWEEVAMRPQRGSSAYEFLFAGLPENVEYYVTAGPLQSEHFTIRVVDLPAIKDIRVTYRYPSWTGLQNVVEEQAGDLRAIEGTEADLEIEMDRPVRDGLLVVDDQELQLADAGNNVYRVTVPIQQDGIYHVAALDEGQRVRLSNDYFIEAQEAVPPLIRVSRPGRDYRASPIEEVTVSVSADAEFGLNEMTLHYSVNGGPEQTVNLLREKGATQADGSTTLYLEDYNLVPGDVISLYARAKDARSESHTDMYFVQADPFEREFSQSQMGGGGGGGGGGGADQSEISRREKEIIAATWKQRSEGSSSSQQAAETADFLANVQSKLRDQALSLSGRMQRRGLTQENEEFSGFQEDMTAAAEAMGTAAEHLKDQNWAEAIPAEQKALQHLLRAEATFRQIQVAFGSRGGGGGGGGAGRDLESLFDLELDTEMNQYETGQTASSASQREQEIDEALQKLEELARRQQNLADQQMRNNQSFQQRWQQEMLRREAEELQRQMEQLARNSQSGQQNGQSSQQGGQQGSSASGQSGSSGGQGQTDPRVQQALERIRQANEDMRRAASRDPNSADARRAAERLQEASSLLGGIRQQQATAQLDSMAREADRLANEQREQSERAREAFGEESAINPYLRRRFNAVTPEQAELAEQRQQLADDLAALEREMQTAARDLAATQRSASAKLREALGDSQQNDLRTRLQRSAEWMRNGIDPNAGMGEPALTAGMQRLSEQVRQAQQALTGRQGEDAASGTEQALNQVEQLRRQMESLSRGNGQQGQGGQQGQSGQQGGGNQAGGNQAGGNGDRLGAYGGGPWQGGFNGMNAGDRGPNGGRVAPLTPAEAQQLYRQTIQGLNQLGQSVQDVPGAREDVRDLIRQMQQLDPSRFPGNPALVEQLRTNVLATIDRLELQLRRDLEASQPGQIRGGDSLPVPSGYRDSVAEYFRRLSDNQ